MPFEPDPLSVRYEAAAGRFLGEAIAGKGKWHYRGITRPGAGPRTREWLRGHGISLDAVDSGGLTAYERAYQRAVYRLAKQVGISVRRAELSLQRQWGPVTASGRLLGIRVSDGSAARAAVARKRKADRWTENPALRSGAAESGQQRFG